MAFRHVLRHRPVLSRSAVHPGVGAYANPVVEDLHHPARDADVDLLLDVLVAHAVEIPLHLDVVVEGDGRRLPHGDFVGTRRQGEKEIPLFLQKDAQSAPGALLEGALVQFLKLLPNLPVEFPHREEGSIPQRRRDPGGDVADRSLDARLVLGMPYSGRNDRRSVVLGHFVVRSVDDRRIPVRLLHAGLEIVRHHHAGNSAEVRKSVRVPANPALHAHVREGFHVGVLARRKHRDEEMHPSFFACDGVANLHPFPRPVHLHAFSRLPLDMHGRLGDCGVLAVDLAELCILIRNLAPFPTFPAVLVPQKRHRHSRLRQFPVNGLAVRRPGRRIFLLLRKEQLSQVPLADFQRQRPCQSFLRRPSQHFRNGVAGAGNAPRDAPPAQPERGQPQNLPVLRRHTTKTSLIRIRTHSRTFEL